MNDDLSTATDALNEKLASAEKALQAMVLGVEGSTLLYGKTRLTFRKKAGSWRLLVLRENESEPVILLSASREDRIRSAHALGALLEDMKQRSAAERSIVDSAVQNVDAFLASVAPPTPKSKYTEGSEALKTGLKESLRPDRCKECDVHLSLDHKPGCSYVEVEHMTASLQHILGCQHWNIIAEARRVVEELATTKRTLAARHRLFEELDTEKTRNAELSASLEKAVADLDELQDIVRAVLVADHYALECPCDGCKAWRRAESLTSPSSRDRTA